MAVTPWVLWLVACGGDPGRPTTPPPEPTAATSVTGSTSHTGVVTTGDGQLVVDGVDGEVRSPVLAEGAEGGWYVAFARDDADGYTRAYVARSDDGATFDAPVALSEPGYDVQTRWPDGPSLLVADDRVLLAYVAGEGASYVAHVVQVGTDLAEPQRVAEVTMPPDYHTLTYPTLALDDDGQALVAMIAAPFLDGRLWLARERFGWSVEDVTVASPLEPPCECCPPALHVRPDGEVVVAWRGDIAKEIFVAYGPDDGPIERFEVATATGVSGPLCPLDGPQLFEEAGELQLAWSDTRTDGASAFWSTRGAKAWSHTPIAPLDGLEQWRVAVAGEGKSRVFAWEIGLKQSYRWAEAGADEGQVLAGPTGPLREVRAATRAGYGWAVGVDEEGSLWLVSLAP